MMTIISDKNVEISECQKFGAHLQNFLKRYPNVFLNFTKILVKVFFQKLKKTLNKY